MINTIKSNIQNLRLAFNQINFDKFFGKIVSAISALAIINASAYSGYISAQSQATIEEVVVTSRKKSESLQDVPYQWLHWVSRILRKKESMFLKIIYSNCLV